MTADRATVPVGPDASERWWPGPRLATWARATGWRPTPFQEFVVKVHQRCNLACDYCYMYTLADQSWRRRPLSMSRDVWHATARRIGEHARQHALADIRVVLHGGEPLLLGPATLGWMADALRAEMPPTTSCVVAVQTNGVLLDEPAIAELMRHDIHVGVSVDGAAADHDRHRRFPDGRGSAAHTHRALDRLSGEAYRGVFAGLLCTIDLRTDPVACYEWLLRWRPPTVDFLLPHANWAAPPVLPDDRLVASYGDWLVAVFDRWYSAPRQETRVRLLAETINLALGGASRTEQVGLSPVAVVIVDTDGDIQLVDSLKSAYPGAPDTRRNVMRDPFDACLDHPGVVARQIGVAALSTACRACEVHRICGGGNYAHRHAARSGFRHPTVYCADMFTLIRHVQRRLRADLGGMRSAA